MGDTKVRPDVWTARDGEDGPRWDAGVLAYARAVGVMQSRPAHDARSWAAQAALHRTCPRRSWFFLPWLRMQLVYFEDIVRAIVVADGGPRDWALPFWDTTDGRAVLPPEFAVPALPDGAPNPLYRPDGQRAAWLNAGVPLPDAVTNADRA